MSDPRERRRPTPRERMPLGVTDVYVNLTVDGAPVRQMISVGDQFAVEILQGRSVWRVVDFEADANRPSTLIQSPAGLDVVASAVTGMHQDGAGNQRRVTPGEQARFGAVVVGTFLYRDQNPSSPKTK